jgi:hypothetical protein
VVGTAVPREVIVAAVAIEIVDTVGSFVGSPEHIVAGRSIDVGSCPDAMSESEGGKREE